MWPPPEKEGALQIIHRCGLDGPPNRRENRSHGLVIAGGSRARATRLALPRRSAVAAARTSML